MSQDPGTLTQDEILIAYKLKKALLAWQEARRNLDRGMRDAVSGDTSPTLLKLLQEADTKATIEVNLIKQQLWASFLRMP